VDERFQVNTDAWFYINVTFIFFLIYLFGVYILTKKEERQLIEQQGQSKVAIEKNRIANEMHDDIGADLSNLLFKLKMYQNRLSHKNMEDYHEIERFTKDIIRKTTETIWSLNGEKDTLNALGNFMLKFLNDFLKNTNISYHFNDIQTLSNKAIDIELRRNIFHLFKETVRYICQFEGISQIKVELNFEGEILNISITDNGIHNEIEKTKHQLLQESMNNRMQRLNIEMKQLLKVDHASEISYQIKI